MDLLLSLLLSISSPAHADVEVRANLTAADLGGQILMLQMKYVLVVSGKENSAILEELGEDKRRQLFRDMTLNKSSQELKKIYGQHATVTSLIRRYGLLVETKKSYT